MTIDWTSALVGLVAGLVLGALLRLHSLKRLDLSVRRLGLALGIEGFEEKPQPGGVKIGDVSGTVSGDIAGRDINKNSYLYQAMQAAAREAVRASGGPPHVERSVRISSRTSDPQVREALRRTQDQSEGWVDRYIDAYLQSQDFRRDFTREAERLKRQGWSVVAVRPVDNINEGLMFELAVERDIPGSSS